MVVLLGGARLIACRRFSASTDISSWETPDKNTGKVLVSTPALHQEQNPLCVGVVFTELSYLVVLGAQSPDLYCSHTSPADYNYICTYDIQI